jgi:hypothetical protein
MKGESHMEQVALRVSRFEDEIALHRGREDDLESRKSIGVG